MNEYVIINKTTNQTRIDKLENIFEKEVWEQMELDTLKKVLSQSTLLIPEIEKAFDTGSDYGRADALFWSTDRMSRTEYEAKQDKEDYISNLKLNI